MLASGNAQDKVMVQTSTYTKSLLGNDAIVGKAIQIGYAEGKIEEGTLSFKLDEELIHAGLHEELDGIKNYYAFTYSDEGNVPVPVPTEYDQLTNTLKANIKEQGTYFIMDLTKLYTQLGILDVQNNYISPKMYAAPRQLNVSQAMQENAVSEKTNKMVDLVFVIDTNYTIESYLPIIKESLSDIMHKLSETEKIDLNVSVVDYQYRHPSMISIRINNLSSVAIKERNENPFNKDIDVVKGIMEKFALSMPGSWDLNSVPIGAFGYVEEFPFRQNSNRFALLITDKTYRIDNDHGYNDVYELFDKLNAKDISVSVATLHTINAYDKWAENCNGIKINMFKKVNFAEEYTNFVLNNISQGINFKIIASNTLKEINLAAPLKFMGQTNTDEDGLTDSDEVQWNYVELKEDGSFTLPMLGGLWVQTYPSYDAEAFENLPFLTELKELRVLPLKSDPTLKDSDDDGLEDKDDEYPFINTIKGLWYKVTLGEKDIYIGQEKYGEQYLRAKLCDKGSTEGEVYKFTGIDWILTDEAIDLSNITSDVTLGEDALYLNNIEEDIVVDINEIVDFSSQPDVNYYLQQCEEDRMVEYGMLMGSIDSIYPKEDTALYLLNPDKLLKLGVHREKWFVKVYIASSYKVKSGILYFINKIDFHGEEITLEKLEQNKTYLGSKMLTELVWLASSVHEGAMTIMAGSSMITSGIAKFTAGGSGACLLVGIPGDEIITIPLTVVGAAEATAGLAVAGVGAGIALSIGGNAASSARDDYDKLKILNKLDDGLGSYKSQGGHHPLAKKAFEGVKGYDKDLALSISPEKLDEFKVKHTDITGQQCSLYTEFAKTNKPLTMEVMRKIEIEAMTNAGVPLDYATNAVDKAIKQLLEWGVTQPVKIPWN